MLPSQMQQGLRSETSAGGVPVGGSLGGGSTATSAPNSQSAIAAAARSRAGNVLSSVQVVLSSTNAPTPVPAINVPDGCVVRARANNLTVAGNAQTIYLATYPDAFGSGHATPLNQFDDVQFQVTNLGQIWVYGKAGDGVVFMIVRQVLGT